MLRGTEGHVRAGYSQIRGTYIDARQSPEKMTILIPAELSASVIQQPGVQTDPDRPLRTLTQ
jgi:hypothetical protein